LDDSLVVDEATGKAMIRVRVSEGERHQVGSFEIVGNRKFSTEELERFYPFSGEGRSGLLGLSHESGPRYFNQLWWDEATQGVQNLYFNNGYIYVRVTADVNRATNASGEPVVDLRWVIEEGQPAVVNRIEIVGNDVTHEAVIRDAIVLLPGDVYRQDALIRSYQNISNLGFFEQPLPSPDTRKANEQGDIAVVFKVTEKRTGNINFGASVGQGTGLGGFLGLDEPNLFGRGKRGRFQWQFGENINDFQLSYTDPALLGSRISGTLELHNARLRYTIGDLGQLKRRGATLRIGFPAFNDRYTRLYLTYEIDEQTFTASATNQAIANRFGCSNCVRSTVGTSVLRDTRIDLPFATAGAMVNVGVSHSGGVLGGTGNFQRVDLEGRWYAPLGEWGSDARGGGIRFVLAYSTRSGFVFGDAPFFQQLFFMGGTQFGVPLRGYNEFAITPTGFDPAASTGQATGPNSFGRAFFAMTGEVGARLSQIFYLSFFYDAGNLWAEPGQYNPTQLFRGAGIGLSVVSPFGPIGIDWAYGFDRTDSLGRPDPGWKFHFKLGNFF
jgi:outer membrane protein insertion porin family